MPATPQDALNDLLDALARWISGNPRSTPITDPDARGRLPAAGRQAAETFLKGLVMAEYGANMDKAYGLIAALADRTTRYVFQRDLEEMKKRVLAVGFGDWFNSWKTARQMVPLQGRLVLEQVFWDLGGPWRGLVTGFKPLSLGDDGTAAATAGANVNQGEQTPDLTSRPRRAISSSTRRV